MDLSHAEYADEFIADWTPEYTLTLDGTMWHAKRPGRALSAFTAVKLREMLLADRAERAAALLLFDEELLPPRQPGPKAIENGPRPTDQGSK